MSKVSFPLKLSEFTQPFPARHGRVSLTGKKSNFSPSFRRFLTSVHYEFCEFHRRINEPLESGRASPETILVEYAMGLVNRVEAAKLACSDDEEMYHQLARAGMLIELVQICQIESNACKFPRWLIRHGSINLEAIVIDMENFFKRVEDDDGVITDKHDEELFWDQMKKLAILDVSPVIASLLEKYLSVINFRKNKHLVVGEYSASLLLAFYNEVPSLFDLAATTSGPPTSDQLEKRRAYASVALHKDVSGTEVSQFFWKLQIGDEADYGVIRSFILDLQFSRETSTSLAWYEKLGLVWCWLHVVDEPGDALSIIAKDVAGSTETDMNVSVIDACMFSVFTNELVSLFTLIVSESFVFGGSSWFSAIISDLMFYTGSDGGEILGKLRDKFFIDYSRDLMSTCRLGVRMACDIVATLGPKSAARGSEELVGRLASSESDICGRTRQWLLAVKLSHDHNLGQNLTESLCLEKFHSDSRHGRIVDAIQSLAVASEVGKDVHVGACRISDYLDQLENVREKFHLANRASLGLLPSNSLLPEYINSGRFDFFARIEACQGAGRLSNLISLVTSPDCPPESVVELVSEIRHEITQAKKVDPNIGLSFEEGIALSKALIDVSSPGACAPEETLMSWITDEMMNSVI
jgi:hypothetical protein